MVSPRWEAYQVGAQRCMGLDLKRSQYIDDFGNYDANAATEFLAGQLVSLNADQEIVISDGATVFGVAKYDKTNNRYATVVGEYIQLNGVVATPLAHANISVGVGGAAAGVRVAELLTGAPRTETTHYTVNYVNGTITRVVVGGGIADGAYVYVNYTYELTATEENQEGKNFWLQNDDVTIQDGRITVITGKATLFTSQYDRSLTYAVNDVLRAGLTGDTMDGSFTNAGGGTVDVGFVFQIPTADDPYLGVTFTG